MGLPMRLLRADWCAPALFWTAERNSGVLKGARGSGMVEKRVLEYLQARL